MALTLRAAAAVALMVGPGVVAPAGAQTQPQIERPAPILTIDPERLFAQSLWGKRSTTEVDAASTELAAENRGIEARLTDEERALTDQRPTLSPEEFRALADAFDAKVVEIRRTQDAKLRGLSQLRDAERRRFFAAVIPILGQAMLSRGAVAILDTRAVFLASDVIDITDDVIASVDAEVGEGTPPDAAPAPDPVPQSPSPTEGPEAAPGQAP